MASLKRELAQYLSEAAREPFVWGSNDCAVGLVAQWVQRRRGVNPALPYQNTYRTALGAQKTMLAAGCDLAGLFAQQATAAGIQLTENPVVGDVAVVQVISEDGVDLAGAIRTGIGWAVRTPNGIRILQAPVVAAWEI